MRRFSERAEKNPRQWRSPPAESRLRDSRNPPTSRYHPRASDPSRITDGGNPRPNFIPRLRVPVSRHPRLRTLPSPLSLAIGCHNCGWAPPPRLPGPILSGLEGPFHGIGLLVREFNFPIRVSPRTCCVRTEHLRRGRRRRFGGLAIIALAPQSLFKLLLM